MIMDKENANVIKLADMFTNDGCRTAFNLYSEDMAKKDLVVTERTYEIFKQGYRAGALISIVTLKRMAVKHNAQL